jgi:hypothetical protein
MAVQVGDAGQAFADTLPDGTWSPMSTAGSSSPIGSSLP